MYVVPSTGERGLSGSLAFLWNDDISPRLRSFSKYHFEMEITISGKDEAFRVNRFDDNPVAHQTQQGWKVMKQIKN